MANVVLNETLTQNETKYLKELIEDTGGGQFTSDIMECKFLLLKIMR